MEIEEIVRIQRLTKAELWKALFDAVEAKRPFVAIQAELEKRLRRVGFLPALPAAEEGASGMVW